MPEDFLILSVPDKAYRKRFLEDGGTDNRSLNRVKDHKKINELIENLIHLKMR